MVQPYVSRMWRMQTTAGSVLLSRKDVFTRGGETHSIDISGVAQKVPEVLYTRILICVQLHLSSNAVM